MRGFPRLFADWSMLFGGNDGLIGLPEIRIARSTPIGVRNGAPELATRGLTPITNHKRHDLAGFSTQGEPNPDLIDLLADKGPELVEFQRCSSRIVWFGWNKCLP